MLLPSSLTVITRHSQTVRYFIRCSTKICKKMAEIDSLAITNFQEYLRIKTVQPTPDYAGAISFLTRMANELQLPHKVFEYVAHKPVFVMTFLGKDCSLPTLLLNSHIDVVPVFPDMWKYDPFSATIDDKGDIYARGTQDMKCVGIQYLEAMRRIKASGTTLQRTVHVSFVPDEEIGGADGMQLFVKSDDFKQLNVGFVLDEGLASPSDTFLVYYGERSPWWLEVTCPGNPGHGSLFIENNAANKLRKVINSFLDFRDHEECRLKSDPLLSLGDVTSVNLTKIEGGVQINVVPSMFAVNLDIRISPTVDLVKFEEKIKSWCEEAGPGVTYRFIQKNMDQILTPTTDTDPWWKAFSSTAQNMNLKIKQEIFPAATDSRFLRAAGFPAIGFSPMNHTPVLLHDHNEFLNRSVFLRGIDIYIQLISNLANVQPFKK